MKTIDTTKQVMNKVTQFEEKRSKRFIFNFIAIVSLLLFVLISLSALIVNYLFEQDTFSLFTLFTQDLEVISLYWQDTLQTVLQEIPFIPLILSIILLFVILIIGGIFSRRIVLSLKRLKVISSMAKRSNKSEVQTLGTAIALGIILAAVLIGAFLLMKPSDKNSEMTRIPNVSSTPSPEDTTSESESLEPNVASNLSLVISSPQNQSIVTVSTITIKGKTAPRSEIFVNDKELKADASGNFSTSIILDQGENIISVSANDEEGNYATQELSISYDPGN